MKSTSSRYADFAGRKNRALGHVPDNGQWVTKYKRNADTEAPAGGVSSSVNDLAKWLRLQLAGGKFDGKQIVAESALAETRLPHMLTGINGAGLPGFYGLTWNVDYHAQGALRLSHSGAFALGAGTAVYLVPGQSLGIIVLTNAWPTGVAEALCTSFLDLVLEGKLTRDWLALYKAAFAQMMASMRSGTDYTQPPATPEPQLANAAYTGTYINDFFGDIVIAADGNGLAIAQGPKPLTFAMTHFDRDTFFYKTEGESAIGLAGITFTIEPDGKAGRVAVENLNGDGSGVFVRKN